eukprot:213747-Chlamydomonas_euryale.AAC.6
MVLVAMIAIWRQDIANCCIQKSQSVTVTVKVKVVQANQCDSNSSSNSCSDSAVWAAQRRNAAPRNAPLWCPRSLSEPRTPTTAPPAA